MNRPLVAVKRNKTISRIATVTKLFKCQLLFHAAALLPPSAGLAPFRASSFHR